MDPSRLAALLDANAAALDLEIADAHRSGVLSYLALAESMYRGLGSRELTPADESGLVFVPQAPESPRG